MHTLQWVSYCIWRPISKNIIQVECKTLSETKIVKVCEHSKGSLIHVQKVSVSFYLYFCADDSCKIHKLLLVISLLFASCLARNGVRYNYSVTLFWFSLVRVGERGGGGYKQTSAIPNLVKNLVSNHYFIQWFVSKVDANTEHNIEFCLDLTCYQSTYSWQKLPAYCIFLRKKYFAEFPPAQHK